MSGNNSSRTSKSVRKSWVAFGVRVRKFLFNLCALGFVVFSFRIVQQLKVVKVLLCCQARSSRQHNSIQLNDSHDRRNVARCHISGYRVSSAILGAQESQQKAAAPLPLAQVKFQWVLIHLPDMSGIPPSPPPPPIPLPIPSPPTETLLNFIFKGETLRSRS